MEGIGFETEEGEVAKVGDVGGQRTVEETLAEIQYLKLLTGLEEEGGEGLVEVIEADVEGGEKWEVTERSGEGAVEIKLREVEGGNVAGGGTDDAFPSRAEGGGVGQSPGGKEGVGAVEAIFEAEKRGHFRLPGGGQPRLGAHEEEEEEEEEGW